MVSVEPATHRHTLNSDSEDESVGLPGDAVCVVMFSVWVSALKYYNGGCDLRPAGNQQIHSSDTSPPPPPPPPPRVYCERFNGHPDLYCGWCVGRNFARTPFANSCDVQPWR